MTLKEKMLRVSPGLTLLFLTVLYILLPFNSDNPEWEIKDVCWAVLIAIGIVANAMRWRQRIVWQRVCLGLLLLLPLTLVDKVVPSSARRHLPAGAADVREYYHGSFTGDYIRFLRARMSDTQFREYARNLGMTNRYAEVTESGVGMNWHARHIRDVPWWTPPSDVDNAFIQFAKHPDGRISYSNLLGYTNGYAYFVSIGM